MSKIERWLAGKMAGLPWGVRKRIIKALVEDAVVVANVDFRGLDLLFEVGARDCLITKCEFDRQDSCVSLTVKPPEIVK